MIIFQKILIFANFAKNFIIVFWTPLRHQRYLHAENFCYDVTKTLAVTRGLEGQACFYRLFHFLLCMFLFQRWHLQKEEKEGKLHFKPNCCKYQTANILTRKRTQIKRLKIFHTNSLMFYTGKKKTYTKVIILEKKFHAVTKNLLMYILRTLKKLPTTAAVISF